ncbi:MAG: hypothetical protein AB7F72_06895 [Afipia sp.]
MAAVAGMLLCASATAHALTQPKVDRLPDAPKSVLFVGNSYFYYNNSLHDHVLSLLRSADPTGTYTATSATISGASLTMHDVDRLLSAHKRKEFDAVIMMDCSWCAVDRRAAFARVVAKDVAVVRRHRAAPVLFMTWAYADKPRMIGELADVYTAAGNANNALVVPAGLAFARSLSQRPELALHVPDRSHPTLAGTYLAACVVMASVYRRSPVGNAYRAGLDDGTAAFLQTIAWDTVRDYYRQ